MKTFTKDMLVPGKHVVEMRNEKRYLVAECNGKIYLTNFAECFNSLSGFDEEMRYTSPSGERLKSEDAMKVFVMTSPVPIGQYLFDDRFLTEIWHREEIFITPDEKAILRNIKVFEYIARDKNKLLCAYGKETYKDDDVWTNMGTGYLNLHMFNHLFQMVQWTDDEPWKIEDLLKLPEKEGDSE